MEKKEDNIDIFVCAHKDFDCKLKNNAYKIICGPDDEISPKDIDVIRIKPELSNVGFSEWQKFYYIWKYMYDDLKDYVGLMHYRRILKLADDINEFPDMDEVFSFCDLVVADVAYVTAVWEQYEFCHNLKDLITCGEVIGESFPEYVEAFEYVMNAGVFFICNTCIIKKEDFKDLCEFLFGVTFKWCEKNGIDFKSDQAFFDYIDKDIESYSKKRKEEDPTFREQARIPSYLIERLFNVWAVKNKMTVIRVDLW